jgi:uncharacterized membrane-anchored protein
MGPKAEIKAGTRKRDSGVAGQALSKVPQVTVLFWILKIAATALGGIAGDVASMSMGLGHLVGVQLFAAVFALAVTAQLYRKTYSPLLYWLAIVAAATLGAALAEYADRSLGIGDAGGAALWSACLGASLFAWYKAMGAFSGQPIHSILSTFSTFSTLPIHSMNPKAEMFYWIAILFAQTWGMALGDWTADAAGLGDRGVLMVFGALSALAAAGYFWTRVPRTLLFWAAFVATGPLSAVVVGFLEKPAASGGLALSRYSASAALLCFILACIVFIPKRRAAK